MIEATEKHKVEVLLKRPFSTGVWFGLGLICAPVVGWVIVAFVAAIIAAA